MQGGRLLALTLVFGVAVLVVVVGVIALVAVTAGGSPVLLFGDECDRADCSAGPVLALGGVVAFFCFCAGFIAAYFVTTKRD